MGNIQEIPPSVLKSWPTPNYVYPIRRTWMPVFALTWQVASTILVWGRFYLRIRHLAGPFGYDDAFMLVAWVSGAYPETVHESSLTVVCQLDELSYIHWLCLAFDSKSRSRQAHVGCSHQLILRGCNGLWMSLADRQTCIIG